MTMIYTARGVIKQSVDYVGMAATRNIYAMLLYYETWVLDMSHLLNLAICISNSMLPCSHTL